VAVHFILLNVVNDKEGTEDNNVGSYSKVDKEMNDLTLGRIGKLDDECAGMQGFVIFGSFGGCTGVGFGSLFLEFLSAILVRKEARVDNLPGSSAVGLAAG
jgi:hypothetical protein